MSCIVQLCALFYKQKKKCLQKLWWSATYQKFSKWSIIVKRLGNDALGRVVKNYVIYFLVEKKLSTLSKKKIKKKNSKKKPNDNQTKNYNTNSTYLFYPDALRRVVELEKLSTVSLTFLPLPIILCEKRRTPIVRSITGCFFFCFVYKSVNTLS